MREVKLDAGVVVLTGGSMGIGLACADELRRCGADVVIAARNSRELRDAATTLRLRSGGRVLDVPTDVADQQSVLNLFDAASALGAVTGVVHAAGVYGPIGSVPETDPDLWLETVRIDLFGSYLVAREACRRMIQSKTAGSIVLVAGGGGGGPFPNYSAYAVSKVGVVRLAETMALECAPHGIRVNALAPGFVATRLHQQTLDAGPQRAGEFFVETKRRLEAAVPAEVSARAAAFLLSDRAAAISGRFLAAPYDDWEHWPDHAAEFLDPDLFSLRRVTPRDRGKTWQ